MIDGWTKCALVAIGLSAVPAPGIAQDGLDGAPGTMSLQVTTDPSMIECRKLATVNPALLEFRPLRRTFNDDFDVHPLATGRWVPHYAGGAAWPEARYWGGDGSDFKRKTSANGEQQIYVDPRYAGRAATPLGLDPFRVKDGVLSIIASRTPPELKSVLFNNEYISGILTTQGTFAQKHGYFEIRAKVRSAMRSGRRSGCWRMTAAGRPRSTCWKAAASGPAIS